MKDGFEMNDPLLLVSSAIVPFLFYPFIPCLQSGS